MAVGQVSFHNDKMVSNPLSFIFLADPQSLGQTRSYVCYCGSSPLTQLPPLVHVATRENPIVNRLNKTKEEKAVDHEQEKVDRIKKENAQKRSAAQAKVTTFCTGECLLTILQKKQDAELAKQREAEKAARSYDSLFNVPDDDIVVSTKTGRELEEDFM